MSNEPAKKPVPPAVTELDRAALGLPPPGYTVRMAWINLIPKDLTIGGASLFNRVDARKPASPTGNDIYWSRDDRHYWVGRFIEGNFITGYRLHETLIGTSSEWIG